MRQNFYTAEKKWGRRMLSYIIRVEHLGSVQDSLDLDTDSQEMAMAKLSGLPVQSENIITPLDAFGDRK